MPKELYNNIIPVDKVAKHFKHGSVLEVIMTGNGTDACEHRAISTGVGVCWDKDVKGNLIGGWATEYFDTLY